MRYVLGPPGTRPCVWLKRECQSFVICARNIDTSDFSPEKDTAGRDLSSGTRTQHAAVCY